ncbi:MAG: ABC transporter permease, partial [Mesorhizobium sp.]
MKLLKHLGYRLLVLVPQLLAISFVTFGIVRLLPGDPARLQLGPLAPEATVEKLRGELLLNRPIWEQYTVYLKRLLQGDFGRSWVNGTFVAEDLATRLPATLELIFLSLLTILLILVPMAIVTASDSLNPFVGQLRRLAVGYGMLAGALPDFLLGLLLIFVFFVTLGWLPGPEGQLGILDIPPERITGFVLVDS